MSARSAATGPALTPAAEAALGLIQTLHGEAANLHSRVHRAWSVARLELADQQTPLAKALAAAADGVHQAERQLLEAIALASCPFDRDADCMVHACPVHVR